MTGKCEQQPARSPPTIFSPFWVPNISAEADPNRSRVGWSLSPFKEKINILNRCGRTTLHELKFAIPHGFKPSGL